jgi:putative endonuclease
MGKHNELGQKGEDLAARYLSEKGFQILERNWRHGRAELDIIACDGETLVFVEVKTRSDDIFERPENAVNTRKRGLMIKAAIGYLHKSGYDKAIRFDVVSIILRGGKEAQIDYFRDAFFPELAE